MNKFSFDEQPTNQNLSAKEKGIIGWLIRKNVVENKQQAFIVLLATTIICSVLIVYFNWPDNPAADLPTEAFQDQILNE